VQNGLIDWTAANRVVFKGIFGTDTTRSLYQVDASGANLVRVPGTTGDVNTFGISADGTRIAYSSETNPTAGHEIYVMPANASSAPVRITSGTIPDLRTANPFDFLYWSPNGTYIAFVGDLGALDNKMDPYVIPSAGGALVRLVTVGGATGTALEDAGRIAWTPDSTRLAFLADHRVPDVVELFLTNDVTTVDQEPQLIQGVVSGGSVLHVMSRP
jgi:Tol biopolymer transport system component